MGTVSGSNACMIALADGLDLGPLCLSFSDLVSLSWRYGRLGFTSTSAFSSTQGLASQDFRASLPLGETLIQGAAFFPQNVFSRASLYGAGAVGGGITVATTFLLANVGSVQTPAYGFGTTLRASGAIPDFLRWMAQTGIGATPGGQVLGSRCFGGARLSLSDIPFCSGKLAVDVVFPPSGPFVDEDTGEYVTWTAPLPFRDFRLRVAANYVRFLDLQGILASVAGSLCGLSVYGNLSFDDTYAFVRGGWQASGPLFGGDVSTSLSLGPSGIVGVSFSYTFSVRGVTVTLQPEITFPVLPVSLFGSAFDIPSLRADFRYPITCCDGISLGDLSASVTLSTTGIDSASLTYIYRF